MIELKLFKRKNRNKQVCIELDEHLRELIDNYMVSEGLNSLEESVKNLVSKGYWYWILEKKYGRNRIDSVEVWGRAYDCLRIESGYLYYRLRLRDVIEEMRKLIMILSSVLSDLKTCYNVLKNSGYENISSSEKKIKEYQDFLKNYMENYVLALRRELDEKKYVEDEESLLNDIVDLVEKYRRKMLKKNC